MPHYGSTRSTPKSNVVTTVFKGDKELEKTRRLNAEGEPCLGEDGSLSHVNWQEAQYLA